MRVAIECRSPLLQKSLENFLEGHLCSIKSCDVVLSDESLLGRDNALRIGSDSKADIIKPFSKSQLLLRLEHFYKIKEEANTAMSIADELDILDSIEINLPSDRAPDSRSLEEKIEQLTSSYVQGVMSLVREYRG